MLQEKLGMSKSKKAGKKRKAAAETETKGKQTKKIKEEKKEKSAEELKEEEALKVIYCSYQMHLIGYNCVMIMKNIWLVNSAD